MQCPGLNYFTGIVFPTKQRQLCRFLILDVTRRGENKRVDPQLIKTGTSALLKGVLATLAPGLNREHSICVEKSEPRAIDRDERKTNF